MNAGGVLSGGNVSYGVYGGMQAADHIDLAKGTKNAEALAEILGNQAGAEAGDAINKAFNDIKNGNDCEKASAASRLEKQLGAILCE